MLRSILCDYSDIYILVKGKKQLIIQQLKVIIDCISKINNTQADNAKGIDIVMPIYKGIGIVMPIYNLKGLI